MNTLQTMPFPDPTQIHITTEVYDFMFIRIDEPMFQQEGLEYAISDSNGELIRKGLFRGSVIQLRLSHLNDGIYNLSLSSNRYSIMIHQFTKKTPTVGQETNFSF